MILNVIILGVFHYIFLPESRNPLVSCSVAYEKLLQTVKIVGNSDILYVEIDILLKFDFFDLVNKAVAFQIKKETQLV